MELSNLSNEQVKQMIEELEKEIEQLKEEIKTKQLYLEEIIKNIENK